MSAEPASARAAPPLSRRALVLAALAGALQGCAAPGRRNNDHDLRLEAASHHFGGRFDYLFVHSAGAVADRAFVTLSRATGSSTLARELAGRIAPAERVAVRMVVSGPDAAKTVQVIHDALAVFSPGGLPHLELMYLGEPEHAPSLREQVQRVGAHFRFAPFAS